MLGTAVKLSIVARSPREQHTFASDVADGGVDGADHVVVLGRYGGTMKALRRTLFTVMLMAGALPSFSACA